jgi:xylose isomerase
VRRASYDVEGLGARSVAMEALDQLAMEHLLGVR